MSSKNYARYVSAVCVFPIKKVGSKTMVLLQKRANTGFADGYWESGAAGHVDEGECMDEAIVHEAKEELGITIKEKDLKFIYFVNKANYVKNPRKGEDSRWFYMGYFVVSKWTGTPTICEPEKCSELKWFDVKHLPVKMIIDRKKAIEEGFNKGNHYGVFKANV